MDTTGLPFGKPVSPPPAKPRRVKRKNVKRSTAAFAHNYGSLERVLWVKAQKCCWCEALGESLLLGSVVWHGAMDKSPLTLSPDPIQIICKVRP